MAGIGFFDANSVEPSSGREAFPKGDYRMAITASEVKTTKAGTGKYVSFEWTVIEGEYKGRKVWQNVNFQNPSAKAQQIGQAELSAICRACNKQGIRDTSELHNYPVWVRVGIEPDQNGNDRNAVKSVLWKQTGVVADSSNCAPRTEPVSIDEDELPDFLK